MAWALVAAVVLILLVVSAGFRKIALGFVVLLIAIGGIYYLYDQFDQHLAHSRIPVSELAFDGLVLKSVGYGGYHLSGRIKNNSTRHSLEAVEFVVSMRDCTTPLDKPDLSQYSNDQLIQMLQAQGMVAGKPTTFDPTTAVPVGAAPPALTTYTMTGPDGRNYSIDGPSGATPAEVAAQMQAQLSVHAPSAQPSSDVIPTGSYWYNSATRKLVSAECLTIGQSTETTYLDVPPGQARDFDEPIFFTDNLAPKGQLVWGYSVSETTAR